MSESLEWINAVVTALKDNTLPFVLGAIVGWGGAKLFYKERIEGYKEHITMTFPRL